MIAFPDGEAESERSGRRCHEFGFLNPKNSKIEFQKEYRRRAITPPARKTKCFLSSILSKV
jgi:hypothetical protein